jgi:two-component system response regulator DegU
MILDLSIPGLNGLEVARQVVRRRRKTRIVVLSVHDDDSYVRQALKSHVVGYVTKDCPIHILIEAIDSVVSGKYYLSPSLTKRVVREYIKKNPQTDDDTDATSKSKK